MVPLARCVLFDSLFELFTAYRLRIERLSLFLFLIFEGERVTWSRERESSDVIDQTLETRCVATAGRKWLTIYLRILLITQNRNSFDESRASARNSLPKSPFYTRFSLISWILPSSLDQR